MSVALFGAVTRIEAIHGRLVGPAQRIGVLDALRALTASGAYLCGNEASLGTIAPGKYADLTAFGADPFAVAPEALRDLPVDLTLAGGRIVHDRID